MANKDKNTGRSHLTRQGTQLLEQSRNNDRRPKQTINFNKGAKIAPKREASES